MRHFPATLICLLPLCGAAPAVLAQAALSLPAQTLSQQFLSNANAAISDVNSDSAAPTFVQDSAATFVRFDAATGVLVGVDGLVTVATGSTLATSRGADGGNYFGLGTVRATWQLGSAPGIFVSTGSSWLAQAFVDRDTPSTTVSSWSSLAYSASAAQLDSFAGTSSFTGQLSTSISAFKENGAGGNGGVSAAVFNPAGELGLTGALRLSYSHLAHANASFDLTGDTDSLRLEAPAGFSVVALGDEHSTGLQLLDVACSGDCGAFLLTTAGAPVLRAGESLQGTLLFLDDSVAASATYTFSFSDDLSVGAASTRRLNTVSLSVENMLTAVPEPSALWLMGAGLLLVVRRRASTRA